jgi:tellurite methyltransferase
MSHCPPHGSPPGPPESSAVPDRRKWNVRYRDLGAAVARPEPHPLAVRWRPRFSGGAMLDAACGLGRGICGALDAFDPIYGVDVSDVAIVAARRLYPPRVRWIVADVTALPWPDGRFGLVCSFGFTDLPFLRRIRAAIRPGGMLLYEGFSRRQLEVRPEMNPDWTLTLPLLRELVAGWEVFESGETGTQPYLVRCAAIRPGRS